MKHKTTSPSNLTKAQLRELQLTGMVIVGDRIIRTAAFINRVANGARQTILSQASNLFRS